MHSQLRDCISLLTVSPTYKRKIIQSPLLISQVYLKGYSFGLGYIRITEWKVISGLLIPFANLYSFSGRHCPKYSSKYFSQVVVTNPKQTNKFLACWASMKKNLYNRPPKYVVRLSIPAGKKYWNNKHHAELPYVVVRKIMLSLVEWTKERSPSCTSLMCCGRQLESKGQSLATCMRTMGSHST